MRPVRRWIVCTLACAAALTATGAGAVAQSPATGAMAGTVSAAGGQELSEVHLRLMPTTGGPTIEARTGRDGRFRVPLLVPGSYDVLAERLGYQPVVITDVPVTADRTVGFRAELEPAEGPVLEPVRLPFPAAVAGASLPGATTRFPPWMIDLAPSRDRSAGDLLALSSVAQPGLQAEGLPSSLGGLVVDGVLFRPALHAAVGDTALNTLVYPFLAPIQLQEVLARNDLQWPATAGALLNGVTRPGSNDGSGRAFGGWTSDRLRLHDIGPGGGWYGGFEAGGPLLEDSAHARLFGSLVAPEEVVPLAAREGPEGNFISPAHRLLRAGGHFGWRFGDGSEVQFTALLADAERRAAPQALLSGPAPTEVSGMDVLAATGFTAPLTPAVDLELRGGVGLSDREYSPTLVQGEVVDGPAIITAERPRLDGLDPVAPGRFERSDVSASGTLHWDGGTFLLQGGLGARIASHSRDYAFGSGGIFTFGSAADLADRVGTFFQYTGPAPVAEFSTQRFNAFGQGTWELNPGFDVRTGVRYDMELLPTDDVLRDSRFEERTGIATDQGPASASTLGFTAAFEWDVREERVWLMRGDVTVTGGEVPPEVLAEALARDGRAEVVRAVGSLAAFPDPAVGTTFRQLSILDADYQAPVTTRASLGISRSLGPGTTLLLAGVIRRTENLPRRVDLNRLQEPLAVDQHGRSVFGVPEQAGGLVVARPRSSRRLDAYDHVAALTSDAASDYRGFTAGLERNGDLLDLNASYTYSSTTDQWLGADRRDALGYAPDPTAELRGSWANGISDFDVPHRAVIAAATALPFARFIRLGLTGRVESGRPFTPTFAPGIDANADGVAGNDPAFVDEELPGMDEVMSAWSCLRGQAGRFADRNACRTPGRAALDLRLAFRIGGEGAGADLMIEALDLVHNGYDWYDPALLELDPTAAADLDATDGLVSIPYRVNPGFGDILYDHPGAFRLRASLQLRF